jgi:hypothetical protein
VAVAAATTIKQEEAAAVADTALALTPMNPILAAEAVTTALAAMVEGPAADPAMAVVAVAVATMAAVAAVVAVLQSGKVRSK